ncbi:MAG: aspartate aminotransferase family protein [Gammaproteobacteria bacterium]|nr:aspartate aminotransferase family protein [Gammaproteobacteria bacterium]
MNVEHSTPWRTYLAQNPRSRAHAARAGQYVPAGTSRSLLRHPPFPFYVDRAQGIRSVDLDGNERLDFHNNYTALAHGHGHPQVMAAVERQLARGTTYSAPGAQEFALAEHLCARIASVEQVVFNNSGTEAVMVALRIARAVTGRNRIAKFEGGYHGSTDFVMVGGHGLPAPNDPVRVTTPHADVGGLPAAATEDVVLVRFNDPEAVREAVARFGPDLAAFIVEPIQGAGGVIPATPEFLRVLREETRRAGILLICDEVVTLRHAVGGAQGYYGLDPDLTTMAKIIGGGFPVGAVGGRRAVMRCLEADGPVANLGTFSANPMTMAAGLAAMELLDEAAIARLNALGERARDGLRQVIASHDLPAQVAGAGSLFQVHWTRAPLTDARAVETADATLNLLTFLGLCNRGVQLSMRGIGALSTPMGEEDVDALVAAFDDTIKELRADGWC